MAFSSYAKWVKCFLSVNSYCQLQSWSEVSKSCYDKVHSGRCALFNVKLHFCLSTLTRNSNVIVGTMTLSPQCQMSQQVITSSKHESNLCIFSNFLDFAPKAS